MAYLPASSGQPAEGDLRKERPTARDLSLANCLNSPLAPLFRSPPNTSTIVPLETSLAQIFAPAGQPPLSSEFLGSRQQGLVSLNNTATLSNQGPMQRQDSRQIPPIPSATGAPWNLSPIEHPQVPTLRQSSKPFFLSSLASPSQSRPEVPPDPTVFPPAQSFTERTSDSIGTEQNRQIRGFPHSGPLGSKTDISNKSGDLAKRGSFEEAGSLVRAPSPRLRVVQTNTSQPTYNAVMSNAHAIPLLHPSPYGGLPLPTEIREVVRIPAYPNKVYSPSAVAPTGGLSKISANSSIFASTAAARDEITPPTSASFHRVTNAIPGGMHQSPLLQAARLDKDFSARTLDMPSRFPLGEYGSRNQPYIPISTRAESRPGFSQVYNASSPDVAESPMSQRKRQRHLLRPQAVHGHEYFPQHGQASHNTPTPPAASRGFTVASGLTSKTQLRKEAKVQKALSRAQNSAAPASGPEEGKIGLWGVIREGWMVSWMFVFIPLGFAAYFMKLSPVIVFTTNFLAIVPQAWIMGKSTEDLAASSGAIIGGLLNAWFGNIVEMLLCIAGIRQGELVVVRCTLIGSILSNLLLVTGCSLFAGGTRYKIQQFSAMGANTSASLLLLGVFCASLPTVYGSLLAGSSQHEVLTSSRIVAIFLIAIYFQFMYFQLGTHSWLFNDDADDDGDMTGFTAGCVLAACTLACTFNSEYLIASIGGVVADLNLSKEFIGIILLPIIGNAAEHYTSVVVALANKMDLSLGCAVGSSCQMLLFVTPLTVLSGWVANQPLSLDLHPFQIMILLVSVLIIAGILQDGYSNWLEGTILMTAYAVVALMYYFENPKFSDII